MPKSVIRRDTPTAVNWSELNHIIATETDYIVRRYRCAQWYCKNKIHILPYRQGEFQGYPKGITLQTVSTLKKIEQWWEPVTGDYLAHDIAMPMGGRSGLCAIDLDVDLENDKDGINTFAELIGSINSWSDEETDIDTWIQETARGGRHIVFKFHPEIHNKAGESFTDIDTRGCNKEDGTQNGGVIFVAPTIKLDKNNVAIGTYQWQEDGKELKQISQDLVHVLLGRSSGRIEMPDKFPQGSRDEKVYEYLMSCAGAGYTQEELEALEGEILARMQPPDPKIFRKNLKQVLISRVFASAKKEKRDKVMVGSLDLAKDKKGNVLRTLENLETIIRSAFFENEMGVYYDNFMGNFTLHGVPNLEGRDIVTYARTWISKAFGVVWGYEDVNKMMIDVVKFQKPQINTLSQYLEGCVSSHDQPLEAFYAAMNIQSQPLEMQPIYRRWLYLWLLGAVARGMEPGCKFDYMLILVGAQGIGKSMALSSLVPNDKWFLDSLGSDIIKGFGKKDELMKLQGTWIVEMPEATQLKNRVSAGVDDEMKKFITGRFDSYRAPYEAQTVDHARTCVLASTSNSGELFRDITGNRRYLLMNLGAHKIEWKSIAALRDSLWCYMLDEWRQHGRAALYLNEEEVSTQQAVNKLGYRTSAAQDVVIEWAGTRSRFKTEEMYSAVRSHVAVNDMSYQRFEYDASEILIRDGWAKKQARRINKEGVQEKGRGIWISPLDDQYDKEWYHCLPVDEAIKNPDQY